MNALYTLAKEEWKLSLTNLHEAKSIYAKLGSIGTIEQQDAFSSQVEDIEKYLRLCVYYVQQETGETIVLEPDRDQRQSLVMRSRRLKV
jgi:hypothetical protein